MEIYAIGTTPEDAAGKYARWMLWEYYDIHRTELPYDSKVWEINMEVGNKTKYIVKMSGIFRLGGAVMTELVIPKGMPQ